MTGFCNLKRSMRNNRYILAVRKLLLPIKGLVSTHDNLAFMPSKKRSIKRLNFFLYVGTNKKKVLYIRPITSTKAHNSLLVIK